jgi:hypothetical protein
MGQRRRRLTHGLHDYRDGIFRYARIRKRLHYRRRQGCMR